MTDMPCPIPYRLTLKGTEAAIGYFTCLPPDEMGFEECLGYLSDHPNDAFMRRYVLEQVGKWDEKKLAEAIRKTADSDKHFLSILYEVALLSDRYKGILRNLSKDELKRVSGHTPFVYLRSYIRENHSCHKGWIDLFRANMNDHQPLPSPGESKLPFPYSKTELAKWDAEMPSIETLREKLLASPLSEAPPRRAPEETTRIALERLEPLGIIKDEMKRHVASLSPIALLRQWQVDVSVKNGRHDYTFSGLQTSYGRGLSLESAQASYAMEMVERYASFASFLPGKIDGYKKDHRLIHGSYSELCEGGVRVLDPNTLCLEASYADEPLYWVEAERIGKNGFEPVLVPAQCIFLFCNLDEINLFSGLGSTGLASGNTLEEAKVSALLEIIERDHESVTPFDPKQCFSIETDASLLSALLANYQSQGIRIQFQDLTSSMGVPCCKCFVMDDQGRIIKGAGANLDAKQALISAMTETPFPFPSDQPSGYGLHGLTRVPVENLPDYSTGNAAGDLALLEAVLDAHGYRPIYIDLTRKDVDLPVVRAIVPGMEIAGDFEWYSRVHPRLFYNYLKMF